MASPPAMRSRHAARNAPRSVGSSRSARLPDSRWVASTRSPMSRVIRPALATIASARRRASSSPWRRRSSAWPTTTWSGVRRSCDTICMRVSRSSWSRRTCVTSRAIPSTATTRPDASRTGVLRCSIRDRRPVLAHAADGERPGKIRCPLERAREPLAIVGVDVLQPERGVRVVFLRRVPDDPRRGGAHVLERPVGVQPAAVHEILGVLREEPEALLALGEPAVHLLELAAARGDPHRHRVEGARDAAHLDRAPQRERQGGLAAVREPPRLALENLQRPGDATGDEQRSAEARERDREQHRRSEERRAPDRSHRLVERPAGVGGPADRRDWDDGAHPALARERGREDAERFSPGERPLDPAVLARAAARRPIEVAWRPHRDEGARRVEDGRPARPGAPPEHHAERLRVDRRGHDAGERPRGVPQPARDDEGRAAVDDRSHHRADPPLGATHDLLEVVARVERLANELGLGRGDDDAARIEPAHVAHTRAVGADHRETALDLGGRGTVRDERHPDRELRPDEAVDECLRRSRDGAGELGGRAHLRVPLLAVVPDHLEDAEQHERREREREQGDERSVNRPRRQGEPDDGSHRGWLLTAAVTARRPPAALRASPRGAPGDRPSAQGAFCQTRIQSTCMPVVVVAREP